MSIELVLIPIGIATVSAARTFFTKEDGNTSIATVMKDDILLHQALDNYGYANEFRNEQQLQAIVGEVHLHFVKNDAGHFDCVFSKEIEQQHAEQFVQSIETEYRKLVQQKVYDLLLKQSSEAGLILENEQVDEQQSIVLTFQVNRGV